MRRAQYNKERNEQIAEYRKLLDEHDWFYYQSDDRRVYEAGLAVQKRIEKQASEKYLWNLMFQSKKKKVFKNV